MSEKTKRIIPLIIALMFVYGALISGLAVSSAGKKKLKKAA